MTDVGPRDVAERPAIGAGLKGALLVVLAVGAGAVLYVIAAAVIRPEAGGGLSGLNHGAMARLEVLPNPAPAPSTPFTDAEGRTVRLSAFHGRPVLLNIWATWCAPCKREMPTLAALQRAEAKTSLRVVPVSLDAADGTAGAKAFIAAHAPLPFYQDKGMRFVSESDPPLQGFPTTVLIDRSGQERAVYKGDADWSSPEARAVVERLAGL